ncbi:MAG: hypothetical protein ACEY3D_07920 [Rickettsia sp.]|uniref:hypothetical protein n=1 Tax=Rickettsia sp. TaxID=789 RepID=UPI00397C6E36
MLGYFIRFYGVVAWLLCHSRMALPAWINFTSVTWLDHGIQLKILKLLVFFIVFMDPVVKPLGDTRWVLPIHSGMT